MTELSDQDRAILEIASRTYRYPGDRDLAYRDEVGLSPVRAVQRLNALLDTEAALAHDPVTVNRLRRIRAERQGVYGVHT